VVPESQIPTLRRPEPAVVPEPETLRRPPVAAREPAPETQRSPVMTYVPESEIPTARRPEPEPFPATKRTGSAAGEPELPPVDDGHDFGERAFPPHERRALAEMDPERFGYLVEEEAEEPARAPSEQPAAAPAPAPREEWPSVEHFREREDLLPGEKEYLEAENEAAERLRAARELPPATL